jgi:DNA-binding CsgD family transcriptional regulator
MAMPTPRSPLTRLSSRQRELTALVSKGLRNSEIACHMNMSEAAVKYHLSRAMAVFGVSNRTELSFEFTSEQQQARAAVTGGRPDRLGQTA